MEAPAQGPTIRLAVPGDLEALRALMALAIAENLKAYLPPDLVRASERVMGLDTTLIEDGTYFVVHLDGRIAGCGGWSRRRTLYGGDHSAGRDAALLDPATEAARVRAMYTHPDFVRRGVGRLVLRTCERVAAEAGFARLELMATLSGEPLYRAFGFTEIERIHDGGVPLIRMGKPVDRSALQGDACARGRAE